MRGLRVTHHRNFGKLQAHHHTSYGHLGLMLMMVGILLIGVTPGMVNAARDPQLEAPGFTDQPNGYIGISGKVTGPAPTVPATILTPRSGSVINTSPFTVSGTCLAGTFVSIYDNGVFDGVVVCADDKTYSIIVDLYSGQNKLYAATSDVLGQRGPDSAIVTVQYQPSGQTFDQNQFIANPLLIQSDDPILQGIFPGGSMSRVVRIRGGQAPYAVVWDFGDGTTITIPQSQEGESKVKHTYNRPGNYAIIVRVTDSGGNSAILQLVTVVNGPVTASNANQKKDISGALLGAWPLYLFAIFIVIAFWLGERRELYALRHQNRLLPSN